MKHKNAGFCSLVSTEQNQGNQEWVYNFAFNARIAMQKYYEETQTSAGYAIDFFTKITGGIQFDIADVSDKFKTAFQNNQTLKLGDAKGFDLYFKNYLKGTKKSCKKCYRVFCHSPKLTITCLPINLYSL